MEPPTFSSDATVVSIETDNIDEQKRSQRLAQKRESARKSRLRQKAYFQQLEKSHLELTEIKANSNNGKKKLLTTNQGATSLENPQNAYISFNSTYSTWFQEQLNHTHELRLAIYSNQTDVQLQPIVDKTISHFNDLLGKKRTAAKDDILFIVYGNWTSPAERCIMWIGGFRPSSLLKMCQIIENRVELSESQHSDLTEMLSTTLREENCLSQGMTKMEVCLAESLVSDANKVPTASSDKPTYMSQMAIAMGELEAIETYLNQADTLREDIIKKVHEILKTRQSAHALLAINDYFARLQALSTLWNHRPRQ